MAKGRTLSISNFFRGRIVVRAIKNSEVGLIRIHDIENKETDYLLPYRQSKSIEYELNEEVLFRIQEIHGFTTAIEVTNISNDESLKLLWSPGGYEYIMENEKKNFINLHNAYPNTSSNIGGEHNDLHITPFPNNQKNIQDSEGNNNLLIEQIFGENYVKVTISELSDTAYIPLNHFNLYFNDRNDNFVNEKKSGKHGYKQYLHDSFLHPLDNSKRIIITFPTHDVYFKSSRH